MLLGALSGFTVAITADRRAEEQGELIARRGGEVLYGPVIRTLPLAAEAALDAASRALMAEPPDLVVLCTALGVRGWFSAAEALGFADELRATIDAADVLARGPKASGAAVTAGLSVAWVTPGATYDDLVAELAARPTRRPDGSPVRVALQLDGDGRSPLVARLATLGYDVVPVPVYEWHLPVDPGPAQRVVDAVADRTVDAVSFTSAHAVSNFGEIAAAMGRDLAALEAINGGAVAALCVGPVTAARARKWGIGACVEPSVPRLGAMVQALVGEFAGRSVSVDLDGTRLVVQGRLVSVGDAEPVRLTDREHAVLGALVRRPGAVVSKQALLEEVWTGESDDHVVEVTVGRLRRRLGPAGAGIETVMRRGYRLATR